MALPERQSTGDGFTMGENNNRAAVMFVAIGVLAGFLASLIVGGGGLFTYLISGVIGSFVGDIYLRRCGLIWESATICCGRS